MMVLIAVMALVALSAVRYWSPAFAGKIVVRRKVNHVSHDSWEILKAGAFIVIPVAFLGQGEISPEAWQVFGFGMMAYYAIKWAIIARRFPDQPSF